MYQSGGCDFDSWLGKVKSSISVKYLEQEWPLIQLPVRKCNQNVLNGRLSVSAETETDHMGQSFH